MIDEFCDTSRAMVYRLLLLEGLSQGSRPIVGDVKRSSAGAG